MKEQVLTIEDMVSLGFYKDQELQHGLSYVLDLQARIKIVYFEGNAYCLSIYQDGVLIDLPSGVCKYPNQLRTLCTALTDGNLTIKL